MKRKIEVKLPEKKVNHWNSLLEILINNVFVDWSIFDKGESIRLYPENEHCWSIKLNRNGTWELE